MYIKKITLENFRIFRGKHEFNFDEKKLIIVEGPNGHGKSTIFDAINWCISGKINRYVGSLERTNFNYIINSDALKNNINEAAVEIIFQTKDKKDTLIKRVEKKNTTNKLFVNNKEMPLKEGQKHIVSLLIKRKENSNLDEVNDKIDSSFDLISFIESTLILSQENLEEFVRGNKPTERFKIIERVLGLTKYGVEFKEYLDEFKKYCAEELVKNENKINIVLRQKELLNQENKMLTIQSKEKKERSKKEIINDVEDVVKNYKNKEVLNINQFNKDEDLFEEMQSELNISLEKIMQRKRIIEFLYNTYQSKNLSVDTNDTIKKIEDMKEKIKIVEKKVSERENGVILAYSKKELMNNLHQTNRILIELYDKKEDNDKKIGDITNVTNNICNKFLINYKDTNYLTNIKNDIKIFKEIKEYFQNLLDNEVIFNIEIEMKNIEDEITKLKKELDEGKSKINEYNDKITNIASEIIICKNRKSDKLESNYRNLIHQVQLKLIDSLDKKCVVCGTEFLNEEELNLKVNYQMRKTIMHMSEIDREINELSENQNNLLKLKNNYQNQVEEIESKITEYQKKLNLSDKKIKQQKIVNNIKIESYEMLIIQKNNINNFINKNEDRYLALIKLQELSEKLKEVNLEKKEISKQQENYTQLYSEKKFEPYLNDNKKVEKRIKNINLYLEMVERQFKISNEEINMLSTRIHDLEVKIDQLEDIREELKNVLNKDLRLDSKEINEEITNELNSLNSIYSQIDSILDNIVTYKNNYQLRENEKNRSSNSIEERKLMEIKSDIDSKMNQLTHLSKYHATTQSSLINNYLISISKEINNYYRQISPHSYSNYASLKTQDNGLYIILQENLNLEKEIENIDINASLTLSAAQSTILAMSIFLALNKSQNMSNLNLIGIDDPFQNLDDINSYSFIDLISNLIYKENRQILISTHDSNFGSLTLRKVNINSNNVAYIKIESYTNEAIEITSKYHQQIN